MTTAPQVPAPPPGPGVHPPFPAPPVEGKGKRIGLGLGIGAGVLVLVCGGGLAALIGVAAFSSGSLQERTHAAVGQYLDALRDEQYDKAYQLLCDDARKDEAPAEFRSRVSAEEPIESYQLGTFSLVTMSMPVEATYAGGSVDELKAYLGVDRQTGEYRVCDLG